MRVEESSRVAGFILCWFILQRGGFLHSADAAVGMTKWGDVFCIIGNSSVLSGRNGTQAVPYGFAGGWYRLITQVVFAACHGDESSPLHCVVPFNRTGYICHAPGTAHRPFPTVSLVGGTVQPHKLYMQRPGRQIAAPTIHLFRITVFLTYLSLYCVLSNWENVVH